MKYCKLCNDPISDEHGNRKHCSDLCYDLAKSIRDSLKRNVIAERKLRLKEAENILDSFHRRFGSFRIFDPKLLDQQGFNFSLSERNILHDGKLGTKIGQFAYFLLNPNKLYLWKLKTE